MLIVSRETSAVAARSCGSARSTHTQRTLGAQLTLVPQ